MTVEELVARARAEGWQLQAPGFGHDRFTDNVHVVDFDELGWFLGFLERGETGVLLRGTEAEVAAAAHQRLLDRHRPPATPSAATALRPQGRGSTWTLPTRDGD